VSENESFIDEVTEEVRRDKLYLFLRKYGWVGVIAIVSIVLGSVLIEFRANSRNNAAEQLGDLLVKSLSNVAQDNSDSVQGLSEFLDSKSIISLIFQAKNFEMQLKHEDASRVYDAIIDSDGVPSGIRNFLKFKQLLLSKEDPIKMEKLLLELISPDSSFNLLALEQKVLFNISDGDLEAAFSNLDLILNDPAASQGLKSRISQVKAAMKFDGS
jgi:hypothetical protein